MRDSQEYCQAPADLKQFRITGDAKRCAYLVSFHGHCLVDHHLGWFLKTVGVTGADDYAQQRRLNQLAGNQ